MGQLAEEVKQWNTPLIGAYLVWKFTVGYHNAHPEGDAPIGLLHFIAIAILTSKKLTEPINKKRKSLQSYVFSFEDSKKTDLLLTIHERIKERKSYTLSAIDIAICQGLLVWDLSSAKIYPCFPTKKPKHGKNIKPSIIKEGLKAEILGAWFAEHDLPAIAAYLRVVL